MALTPGTSARIERLLTALPQLSAGQLRWIEAVANQFQRPHSYHGNLESDLVVPCVLQDFGDSLRIHHCFSREAFSKDKFEYVLERVISLCGTPAELAPKGNPGHDITINGQRFSLKTQADKSIRLDRVDISKFMELGKGEWGAAEDDLKGLRDQFLTHLQHYDRILILRTLSKAPADWTYELLEIPKRLLQQAENGKFKMMFESRQLPKPGYCSVYDNRDSLLFELYFDGGTERKLQIKGLVTKACIRHGTWSFPDLPLQSEG